ncbi:hypothetical protein [Dysgonomonas sp. ZJ279]|uniref:hypothetical protein n=1 Tax=Dysgonomonas sp. ZJ279 TaxID=2709796 RepID=UPI0021055377|nr:hypothetical protein [Dysgonomonas sp. ZJ279]
MNNEIVKVIEAIAGEIVNLARLVLEDNTIDLKDSSLSESIKVEIKSMGEPVVIEALFANYIGYLEQGRRPHQGKQPPTDELHNWALSRGIPTDNSTLFLISRAIWRDGYEGRPILATLEEELNKKFEDEWFDQLFEATIEELRSQTFLLSV